MRSLVISEYDKIAALMENNKALDFFISKHEYGVGDIFTVTVENVMPSIDAVFVKLEEGRMGFLHANDVPGSGSLYNRISPGQKLMVQIIKEPTGKKGPRVNLAQSIPGRYFVLTTESNSISISRRISDSTERDRLKSIANLMKPEEIGIVIRTEAASRTQEELEEDFVSLWETWKNVIDKHEKNIRYGLVHKEQDFLYSILRDCFNITVDEIVVDSIQGRYRCEEFLKTWTGRSVSIKNLDIEQILTKTEVEKELRECLSNRVDLPSGGYIIIQTTEALTAIDINSGRFTSSTTLRETVRRTNMEAAFEIARQIRLRNIGGMIIIDFIDMSNRADRISVMEVLEAALRSDKAKPQVGQLSDLCLVEITRKRSGQSLSEIFGIPCNRCNGLGLNFSLRRDDKQPRQQQQHQHHQQQAQHTQQHQPRYQQQGQQGGQQQHSGQRRGPHPNQSKGNPRGGNNPNNRSGGGKQGGGFSNRNQQIRSDHQRNPHQQQNRGDVKDRTHAASSERYDQTLELKNQEPKNVNEGKKEEQKSLTQQKTFKESVSSVASTIVRKRIITNNKNPGSETLRKFRERKSKLEQEGGSGPLAEDVAVIISEKDKSQP